MGLIFVSLIGIALLVSAFEKARDIADRAEARRRAEPARRRTGPGPRSGWVATTDSRSNRATAPAPHRFASQQRRHDADCRAKIRRAEARGNPRRYYVYEHIDSSGRVRYVGHGTKGRAWSRVRATAEHRRLLDHGRLEVRVVQRGLTAREAVNHEADRLDRRTREGAPLFNKLRGTRL